MNGSGHTWNLVKLDGEWYHIDPTWDDSDDQHFYFGVTDEMMLLTEGHAGYTPASGYECTTLADNYYIRSGEVSQWSDRFIPSITAHLEKGEEDFTVAVGKIQDSTYEDTIRKLLSAYALAHGSWDTASE